MSKSEQCPSTKKLLLAQSLRLIEDDASYKTKIRFEPVKKEAQCVKEDGTVDLNVRELKQEEADFHQGIRRKRGSVIEKIRGDKAIPTINEEKRERATNAFLERFSVDAVKNKFKAIMSSIKETVKYGYAARREE